MEEKRALFLQWFDDVGKFAREHEMPMRLTDHIDECRDGIADGSMSYDEIISAGTDILDSIDLKCKPPEPKPIEQKSGVPIEKIKEKIMQAADRCKSENISTLESYADTKRNIVARTHMQIQSFANVDANVDALQSKDIYLKRFSELKNSYEKEVSGMIRSILDEIGRNYDNMADKLKAMFTELGAYAAGFDSERIYNGYDVKKNSIATAVNANIEKTGDIGSEIVELGERTVSRVGEYRVGGEKKRKGLLALPAIIAGVIVVVLIVIAIISGTQQTSSQTSSSSISSGSSEITFDGVVSGTRDIADSVTQIGSGLAQITQLLPTLFIFAGIIVVTVIVGYILYAKKLKNSATDKLKSDCGDYLRGEFVKFENDKVLINSLDNITELAVSEYDKRYVTILNEMMNDKSLNITVNETVQESDYDRIKRTWKTIKTM